MTNYKRRFTKDEFKQELVNHLRDMPPGLARARGRLEAHAEMKAAHYEKALAALDAAMERVQRIAASHPDEGARQEADSAIREINAAIETYGEASMAQNSSWDGA